MLGKMVRALVHASTLLTVTLTITAIASIVLLSLGAQWIWGAADADLVSVFIAGFVGLVLGALLGVSTMRFRARPSAVLYGLITAGSVLGALTAMRRGVLIAGEIAVMQGALCAASSAMGLLSVSRRSAIEND